MESSVVPFNSVSQSREIVTKKGKVVGVRHQFSSEPAGQLNERFKLAGLKGNERKKAVQASLNGTKDSRWVQFEASMSILRSKGAIPDQVDLRSKSAAVKFVIPDPTFDDKERDEKVRARLSAMGLSTEEIDAVLVK